MRNARLAAGAHQEVNQAQPYQSPSGLSRASGSPIRPGRLCPPEPAAMSTTVPPTATTNLFCGREQSGGLIGRRLVIEIDGDIHDWQQEQDQARTQELERHGYRVIRFQNHQVLSSLEGVLAAIHAICTEPAPQEGGPAGEDEGPQPSPPAGGPGDR
jgi:hypothetical protein